MASACGSSRRNASISNMVRDEIPDPPKPSISPPNPGQVKNCFHKYVYPRIFCTIERTASAATLSSTETACRLIRVLPP